ncbi:MULTISPECIES: ubiquinol-cytochrome c reductase iron-sulfur subunit N-terminal domain-containing protein [unclassified Streptomyces]|uniref:ubiquinol-cytochrome c reductase iron-sulfur subunit N-terminal domain-containing protein n=1 Tax=unclassified Streptomyces TaxID=2593676 RepID=UPI0004BD0BB3|nr:MULTISPECIES: ubiquinol-cytochrome c reductase iron-sulfur subunit N-terminal domain-containing protein [unclassified Streptomyces]
MDAQRGHTNRRRFLLIAALPLATVGAGLTYLMWPEPGPRTEVRTDLKPLNRRLGPFLGELTDAHWLGYDIDGTGDARGIPSPDSRIRVVGVARLTAGGAAAITGKPDHAFAAGGAPSDLPAALEQYLPAAATWQHSPGFDAYANGRGAAEQASDGTPSGRYLFDTARDLVHFDVLYLFT